MIIYFSYTQAHCFCLASLFFWSHSRRDSPLQLWKSIIIIITYFTYNQPQKYYLHKWSVTRKEHSKYD